MKRKYLKISWSFIRICLQFQFFSAKGSAVEVIKDGNEGVALMGDGRDLDGQITPIQAKNFDTEDQKHDFAVRLINF